MSITFCSFAFVLHFEIERFILTTKFDMEKKLHNTTEPHHDAKLPAIASTAIVVDLDSLANVCGFFNSETPVNNHYGCNHEECSETELVRINKNGEHERKGSKLERQILMAALRKKYGSWGNIEKASKTKSGIEFIK